MRRIQRESGLFPVVGKRHWFTQAGSVWSMVLVGAVALSLGGCKRNAPVAATPLKAPSVIVSHPVQKDVAPYAILTGTLAANQSVTILPQVNGFIKTIDFKPGEVVKTGRVLFRLDDRAYKAALDQAVANLGVQQALLQNAKDERARQERLAKEDATNEKDLLNARNNERASLASVEAAKAAVEAAQVNFDYCTITAPIDGKVDKNEVDIGDLVGPGPSQTALTTVASLDPIFANFTLPEDILVDQIKTIGLKNDGAMNYPVQLSLGAENDFCFNAVMDFVSNTLDSSTGAISARATAANKDLKLYPGLFVRVKITGKTQGNAVLIREDSLSRDIGGSYVWVIKSDNSAEKRYVKLGAVYDDNMRLIVSGLSGQETYVIDGTQRCRERSKVTPKPVGEADSRPAPAVPASRPTTQTR